VIWHSKKSTIRKLKVKGIVKNCSRLHVALFLKKKTKVLPTYANAKDLANKFAGHFADKISKIRKELSPSTLTSNSDLSNIKHNSKFNTFSAVFEEELSQHVLKGSSKSCVLDPIVTKILKQILPPILPVLSKIGNKYLAEKKFSNIYQKSSSVVFLVSKCR